jgi:uncharacterized protein
MRQAKLSKAVLFIIFLITIPFIYSISKLDFDYDFEKYFPQGDNEMNFYLEFRDKFENDNDFVLLALENKEGIFQQDFLRKVAALTDSIKKAPYIESVASPTNIKNLVIGPLGPIEIPYLHINQPEKYKADSSIIYQSEELIGSFFSSDAKSLALYIKTVENPSKQKSDSIISALNKAIYQFEFDGLHIAGKVVAQEVYVDKMKLEFSIFVTTSLLLVIILLYMSFRSKWGVLVPLIVVVLSMIWLFGFMQMTGKNIDIMTMLLPTIMFVVGMSDIIHIISKYLEELRNGNSKNKAIRIAFKEVGIATFLTSLTTSIGFLTLLTANIQPIREFGVYMAVGVFLAFILAFTVLPAVLTLIPKPKIADKIENRFYWQTSLSRIFIWVFAHQKSIVAFSALIIVLSLVGISKIEVNNFLLEDLTEKDKLKQDFLFFEKNYAGVRPFEMKLKVADDSKDIFDYEVMKEINNLEKYLKDEYGVGFLISPLTIVKSLNKAQNGGSPKQYLLPENEEDYERISQKIGLIKKRKETKAMITEDFKEARISGKMYDLGSSKVRVLDEKLNQFIAEKIDKDILQVQLTGSAMLIDKNNEYLVINMMQGLLIAFISIGIIIFILFKSFKMVAISVVVNIIPLLMIGGLMGFLGLDMKIATSIIFTIAFGIAVDDTIHFVSKFKLELLKGKSYLYSLKRTFLSTGKAIIVTSLILCGGFLTLVFSGFQSIYFVGLLVSLTLLFAVLADLFLLPILILWIYSKEIKAQTIEKNNKLLQEIER